MRYYRFHVGDYHCHTGHLSNDEDLAYRRLLDLYYMHEKLIPSDVRYVSKLIRMQDQIEAVQFILKNYFKKTPKGYLNKRCDSEIEKYAAMSERAKLANLKRWGLKSDTTSDAFQIPTKNQEPRTNNHKDKKRTPIRAHDGFDSFWNAYPRKIEKKGALKTWNKLKPPIDKILEALAWQKETEQWQENIKFVPYPTTYLNKARWEDEPDGEEETKLAWYANDQTCEAEADRLGEPRRKGESLLDLRNRIQGMKNAEIPTD